MDPSSSVKPDRRRALPSVARIALQLAEKHPEIPDWAARAAARDAIAEARGRIASDDSSEEDEEIARRVERRAERLARQQTALRPRRVVNATGIVLHTNLGRAPLGAAAAAAVAEAAAGYSDLELDLETGRRGNRLGTLCDKLCRLSGAEAAHACNNNAAAVLLALDTLARGREVVVSRGELVEIGGSFRIPDIMERAGVRLVEVGSTNRTHLRDYERAIGPDTALLLKVHRSNFEQSGFVAEVGLQELVELAGSRGISVVEDLGSATLVDLRSRGLASFPPEALASARVATGVDLVCFSGDKLLGGPQAGLALGSEAVVDAMRRNPLARALRLDKLGIAALGATLGALLDDRLNDIPVLAQLLMSVDELESRARALARALEEVARGRASVSVEPERSPVGGGSLPGFELESRVVALRLPAVAAGDGRAVDSVNSVNSVNRVVAALRAAPLPVVARVRDDAVLFDPRTLLAGEAAAVVAALAHVFDESASSPSPRKPGSAA